MEGLFIGHLTLLMADLNTPMEIKGFNSGFFDSSRRQQLTADN
jgi:hypothetical protein